MAICDLAVVRYYSYPPVTLVLPILIVIGVCRCHITVYDCLQLNRGCNDLLTVYLVPPRRTGEYVLVFVVVFLDFWSNCIFAVEADG